MSRGTALVTVIAVVVLLLGVLGVVGLFGGLVGLGVAAENGSIPSAEAVEGSELPPEVVQQLIDAGVIRPDERVVFIYAEGLLDWLEAGSLFTEARAIRYWTEDDQVAFEWVDFAQVRDVELIPCEGFGCNSEIALYTRDGGVFWLYVDPMNDGDKRFKAYLEGRIDTWRRLNAPSEPGEATDAVVDDAAPGSGLAVGEVIEVVIPTGADDAVEGLLDTGLFGPVDLDAPAERTAFP